MDMDKMASIYIKKKEGTATDEELTYFTINLGMLSFEPDYVIACIERYIEQNS